MARANTPATPPADPAPLPPDPPAPDAVLDEGVADSDTPAVEPEAEPADEPIEEAAVTIVPVEHWWIATADFSASVDWCTITAKAGVTRFDPVTGATLLALGAAVAPLGD
jgi:hypothetical protein